MVDIETLVNLSKDGDRSAYGKLAEQFQATVWAAVKTKLHRHEDIQDLVQEVLVHAMTHIDQVREPRCFAGWLKQIAVNTAINYRIRQKYRETKREAYYADTATCSGLNPVESLDRSELQAEVREALRRLKLSDRRIVDAYYFQGLSVKEVSRLFDLPIGTVKMRLYLSRNRLRQCLEQPV